jgi:glutamine synthetase
MAINLANWIAEHKIDEVECIVPDINGVQRGKVLPAKKFLSSVRDKSLRIPGSVFICTIDGHYPEDISDIWDKDPDKILIADADTICVAPGFKSPTAFVIADVYNGDQSSRQRLSFTWCRRTSIPISRSSRRPDPAAAPKPQASHMGWRR